MLDWIRFISIALILVGIVGLLFCHSIKRDQKLGNVLITNVPRCELRGSYVLFNRALTSDEIMRMYKDKEFLGLFGSTSYYYAEEVDAAHDITPEPGEAKGE